MNSSVILDEEQVQNFIDYISQENEVSFDFLRYISCEWRINSVQRGILKKIRKSLDVADTNQAILFLLCSKGLGEINDAMRVVSSRDNLNLADYVLMIECIVHHGGGFRFAETEIKVIVDTVTELLRSESNSAIRVFCVIKLCSYYAFCKSRHFVGMKHYLQDFAKSDISSITSFGVLWDYYDLAYILLKNFVETDSDLVGIRDFLISATRKKVDGFSKDFSRIVKLDRYATNRPSKKRICFLSHRTSLYTSYAITRPFYSFLRGLHSSLADQLDFYWYTLGSAADETLEELESMGIKVRRFDQIKDYREKVLHLLNAFDNDGIDVVINDCPSFAVILLYSVRVAPVQIYFCLGFVYFEFEGVDYLLLPAEDKSHNELKTDIISYDSYNWLESGFLEGRNSRDEAQSILEIVFYPKVRQRGLQIKHVVGCYGRFDKISEEYLSVIKAILDRKEDVAFLVFGPGNRSQVINYFTETDLRDRVIISGPADPHILGWAFDVFCEQWPIWSGLSSLEMMSKGIPVVSYMYEDLALFIEPYLSLRDSQLVTKSHQEYIEMVIRLLEDKRYYEIRQNDAKEVSGKVTNLAGRAKDVGKQILLALERTPN